MSDIVHQARNEIAGFAAQLAVDVLARLGANLHQAASMPKSTYNQAIRDMATMTQ